MYIVEMYEKSDGRIPSKDFILSLDIKMKSKIIGLIKVLEEKGIELREPYTKHLEDGIFELRAKHGSNISRVLFFFYKDKRIILTNGFVKKSTKTPRSEINLAKAYRLNFYNQEKEEKNDEI